MAEILLPEARIEALDEGVLDGLAWSNEIDLDTFFIGPGIELAASEFATVIEVPTYVSAQKALSPCRRTLRAITTKHGERMKQDESHLGPDDIVVGIDLASCDAQVGCSFESPEPFGWSNETECMMRSFEVVGVDPLWQGLGSLF